MGQVGGKSCSGKEVDRSQAREAAGCWVPDRDEDEPIMRIMISHVSIRCIKQLEKK